MRIPRTVLALVLVLLVVVGVRAFDQDAAAAAAPTPTWRAVVVERVSAGKRKKGDAFIEIDSVTQALEQLRAEGYHPVLMSAVTADRVLIAAEK